MRVTIPVYAEQQLTPRASDVIRGIVDNAFPDIEIKFRAPQTQDRKILVFGTKGPAFVLAAEYVYTYSIAQVMARANAASVVAAAIRQFVEVQEPIPFQGPVWTTDPQAVAQRLDPTKPTAIDIETNGNLGKVHTPEEVEVISIAFYQPGHPPLVLLARGMSEEPRRALERDRKIAELLEQFTKGIYHNGKFDTRVLNRYFGIKLNVWFDTMLAHHVLNIAAGEHGLKMLAQRYLAAADWEGDIKKYTKGGGHYENIPRDKLVEYNGWDVYWTYKLYELFAPQLLADEESEKAFMFEMSAAKFLLDVETYGVPFDNDYAATYDAELTEYIDSLIEDMRETVGKKDYNPNSPQQVVREFNIIGIGITGTDAKKILKPYLEEFGDVMPTKQRRLLENHIMFKELDKRRGTYARGWAKASRNGRVHPTFLVHGTSTGRLSSTSPNAQNVPREKTVRKLVRTHG